MIKATCEYWQWVIDNGKVKVARCNHPGNKNDGKCEKGKCPKEGKDAT